MIELEKEKIRLEDLTNFSSVINDNLSKLSECDIEIIIGVDPDNMELLNEEFFHVTNPEKKFKDLKIADEIKATINTIDFRIIKKPI